MWRTAHPESGLTIAIPRLDRTTSADRGLTIADFFVPITVGERLNTRVRDIAQSADGYIYLATEQSVGGPTADGMILRLEPVAR